MSLSRRIPLRSAIHLGLLLSPLARAETLEIDPSHSVAQFTVRHLMISNVRGEFSKLAGTVEWDPKAPQKTQISATIDARTINTREAKRDQHLRSADFFEVDRYPTITFQSKKVEPAGQGKLKVTGDLTMHGVTREVVLDVEGPTPAVKDPWGNIKMGATATTRVSRKEFGLNWNRTLEAGGVLVGDEVSIHLDVELARKAPARK